MTIQNRRSLLFLLLLILVGIVMFWNGYRIGKINGEKDTIEEIEKSLEDRAINNQVLSYASFRLQSRCFYIISLKGKEEVVLQLLETNNCNLKTDSDFVSWYLYTFRSTDKPWFLKFTESDQLLVMGPYNSKEDALTFRELVIAHERKKSNTVFMDSVSYPNIP